MPKDGQINKQLYVMNEPDECWPWIGRVGPNGYGKKQWFGKTELAHRWMWIQCKGPIPDEKVINHLCSNRKCVNPNHMELVTQTENCRHGKGTILTEDQARVIKCMEQFKQKGLSEALAVAFNVSKQLIHDIWNGRAWKDI